MNFRGEGILGNPLLCFQKKVVAILKGGGEMKEIPYRLYRKKLYE